MIVGYARISTADQNMDLQIKALEAAGCEKIYKDVISGSKETRPELGKCLHFLKTGDVLVIWKLDRLGRSLKQLVNTVTALNDRGVDIVITTMSIDTRTSHGKLLFGILASVAEFERELIRERVSAGIKAAKDRGVRFGRPPKITGDLLRKAAKMTGTVQEKADALGVSRSGLYKAL